MSASLFFQGVVLGFSIAAPVGPIGVLCIRRTLSDGRLFGLVSGLGAATADAFYGAVAAFGLTLVSRLLVEQQDRLRLLGGLFLCYLGLKTLLDRASEAGLPAPRSGLVGAYGSTFVLTLTNPLTILSFAAIFAGLGLAERGSDLVSAGLLVLGVFLGSGAWWVLLSGGVSLLRSRFDARRLGWVNRVSGAVITVFGLVALWSWWR
jgi:threonine/homoserine/homoserine lactone efflux protein